MDDKPRLIEVAFPLKQASLDSVHEKNVRHGHISTLHIWPARRPLAACRAALIATLLPDPGNDEERTKILEKLGGKVVPTVKKKKMPNGKIEMVKAEETKGGILHWGRESGPDLEWFREEIRKAYGGRAPKVLDPFAGGGAIPLEAMRLGCEATAIDINPVAWFILKCTLEYPQKLAGQKRPLPEFSLKDREFMTDYFQKGLGLTKAALKRRLKQHFEEHDAERELEGLREDPETYADDLQADLAWHVRAWGRWVLKHARKELAEFYPTYASWEPVLKTEKGKLPKGWLVRWKKEHADEIEAKGLRLCPLTSDAEVDEASLNEEFSAEYLAEPTNPRWVPKPTVAYFWARTVRNKHHPETTIPLLKTRWLCKKDDKRVLLTMTPKADGSGVEFGIQNEVPKVGGNTAQRREHDKQIAAGTMTRSGVKCPVHGNILTNEDIRLEGQADRLVNLMTSVAVEGQSGKEYRLPTAIEIQKADEAMSLVAEIFSTVPHGLPMEPLPTVQRHRAVGSQLPGYGFKQWADLFSGRQLASLGTLVNLNQEFHQVSHKYYDEQWKLALGSFLAILVDKTADYGSSLATWIIGMEIVRGTFARFAFSWCWDWCEVNPLANAAGGISSSINWCGLSVGNVSTGLRSAPKPKILNRSAIGINSETGLFDVVFTDPPYYDAIPYSDLMDFFYVWLRRSMAAISVDAFLSPLAPKWNREHRDGELIDDPGAHDGNRKLSKEAYESGMAQVFKDALTALVPEGRCVIVFAHKAPDAWETLVAAIIKSGAVVEASWPIQSERGKRTNAITTASLASSVWLVCRKRHPASRPGWDNAVLQQMREKITSNLRDYWDAGIRGPDFVWAATGPAMEAYSQYPVVKKANKPNELMSVSEFLRHVRRMVLDFVVGRVLSKATGGSEAATEELDDVTTYYLLHRNDFKMGDAPAGACILYCVSCNLSDRDLVDAFDLLVPSGGTSDSEEDEEEEPRDDDGEMPEGSSSTFKLKPWNRRKRPGMGYDPVVDSPKARADAAQGKLFDEPAAEKPRTRIIPLIDQIHRLMHLWKAGDVVKVDDYLNSKGLRTNGLFAPVLQALIEMADAGSEERSILESLSNHVQGRSVRAAFQGEMFSGESQ